MHFLDRSAEAMLTINKRSTLASPIKELFPHDGIAGSWCNFKFFLKNTTAGVKHRDAARWQVQSRSFSPTTASQDHGVILKFFLKNIARSRRWLPTPSPEKSPEKSPDRPLEPPVRPCAMVTPPAHQSNGVRGARGEPMAQALVRSK
ncbi:hypothetical protein ACOSP7_013569 [Xanthoceras sorbifolium]